MKPLIHAALFTMTTTAFASTKSVTYDCGKEFGYTVSLKVRPSKDTFYAFQATLAAPAKDNTTGTLIRSLESELVGSSENLQGKAVYQLHSPKNPRFQVFAEIKATGETANVEVVLLGELRNTESRTRACTVK